MRLLRIIILLLFITAVTYTLFELQRQSQSESDVLRLTMCDVGQGDALLIQWQDTQVLVDAGRGEKVLQCLWSELPIFDHTLELVVATHPDSDHIGGLPLVFDQFSIRSLLLPPITRKTADFAAFHESILRESELIGHVTIAKRGQKISLSDEITLTVLSPLESSAETVLSAEEGYFPVKDGESNNWSIVLLLEYRHFSALLTADAETPIELALIQAGLVNDIDVLKVGHHGSKSSTTDALLDKATPETSLISVGKNNPYGHPNEVVLDRLRSRGVKVLRSDELGAVHIESDGDKYWIAQ